MRKRQPDTVTSIPEFATWRTSASLAIGGNTLASSTFDDCIGALADDNSKAPSALTRISMMVRDSSSQLPAISRLP